MPALSPEGKQSFVTSAGVPLVGGRVYTYDAGTNTPRPTFADAAGTTPNTNPVILDARGEATIFWQGSYKVVLRDAADVIIWTVDNVTDPESLSNTLRTDLASTATGKGAALMGFSHTTTYGQSTAGLALQAFVNVKNAPFNAVGDGVADDTAAIQAAINSRRGIIFFPTGTYKISSTIIVKEDRILVGAGAGAYFAGGGYPRITVLQPTASFAGTKVIDIDPANVSAGLSYIYGVAIRDMLIDCINIKNSNRIIINCASLSNSETFDSVRVINNNSNIGLALSLSANAAALECDGLTFHNFYFLQADSDGPSTTPLVLISAANEVSFRDSKFQRGSNPATATGSMAVQVSAATSRAVNAVTFDSCSFTGAEVGLRIQGNSTDGQGPRWIRAQNCTFEGPKFPIYVSGTVSRPAQFCTFGPGNRMFAIAAGGTGIVLDAYSSNNQVFADEFTNILLNANASGNVVYGGNTVTDSGSNNARISRSGSAIQLSSLFREATISPTLAAGWTNASPTNRTSAGYWKDSQGVVHLQGYVGYSSGGSTLIFTLPAGYVPTRAQIITVMTNTGVGSILINQLASGLDGQITQLTGGTGWVSLDGISFGLS